MDDLPPIAGPTAKVFREQATINADTYVRAHAVHRGSMWKGWGLAVGVALLLALLALLLAYDPGVERTVIVILGLGSALSLFYALQNRLSEVKKSYEQQLSQSGLECEHVVYEFDESGLRTQAKEWQYSISWSRFWKWKDGGDLILLYRHDSFFIILPMTQFTPAAQAFVRDCLTRQCPCA